jgi:hypothetical protein
LEDSKTQSPNNSGEPTVALKTQSKPSDFTGRQRDILTKAAEDELAKRDGEIAMAQSAERARQANEVVDYTTDTPLAPVILDEVQSTDVDLNDEWAVIRVIEPIEDMTFGAGNLYSFVPGTRYRVKKALADHLEEKGYIYSR